MKKCESNRVPHPVFLILSEDKQNGFVFCYVFLLPRQAMFSHVQPSQNEPRNMSMLRRWELATPATLTSGIKLLALVSRMFACLYVAIILLTEGIFSDTIILTASSFCFCNFRLGYELLIGIPIHVP